MAGEIQLNSTTMATESSGTIILSNVDSATNRQNLGLEIGVDVQQHDADTTKNDVANTFTANQIISVTDNTNAALRVTQLGTGNALVVEDETNPDSSPFVVDASGNVGIGTSPLHKLHVKSADATSIFVVGNTSESTQLEVLTYQDSRVVLRSNDNGSGRALAFETGTTERMRIDSSGGITMPDVYSDTVTGRDLYISSSGQLGYVSSIRSSKTNIENLPSISWLYELNPVKFQYRTKDEDGNYTDEADSEIQYGFIAEDVVEVNSDLVFGDETENGFELRGIQYSRLIAPMIKAIQEQQTLIESQQSQIDTLTTKTQEQDLTIASLISRIEALETT